MSKIVVFGAGGFIGRHLTKRLASNEGVKVVAFDRFSTLQTAAEQPFEDYPNVEVVAGDFFNREEVSGVVQGADYVFHLISTTNPAASSNDPFVDIDTNVRNSIQLLELCTDHGVKRVLFPSSGGTVYGDIDSDLISEDTVLQPRSPYGIGKVTVEHYLRYFKFTAGLDYIVYRIANPYGPGQNIFGKQGVIPIFMHKFLVREPISVYGDGTMVRDYIYINDLIEIMATTYSGNHRFAEYNVGSGSGHSVNDIITSVEACAGYTVEKQELPTPPTFVHKSVLNINRLTDEFGPQQFTSLHDGIEKTWDYVKNIE